MTYLPDDDERQPYNNSWVTITVALPKTCDAALPPGEPAGTLGGWWKIRYTFDSATTDTTTWQASIRGNPVHLVQPFFDYSARAVGNRLGRAMSTNHMGGAAGGGRATS